jgi:hypothetical protein
LPSQQIGASDNNVARTNNQQIAAGNPRGNHRYVMTLYNARQAKRAVENKHHDKLSARQTSFDGTVTSARQSQTPSCSNRADDQRRNVTNASKPLRHTRPHKKIPSNHHRPKLRHRRKLMRHASRLTA